MTLITVVKFESMNKTWLYLMTPSSWRQLNIKSPISWTFSFSFPWVGRFAHCPAICALVSHILDSAGNSCMF